MPIRNIAQFERGETASSATLKFKGRDHIGQYALILYGDNTAATSAYKDLLPFKRMANCHPPLRDHYLAFNKLSKSLGDLLVEPDYLNRLEFDEDVSKRLLKSVAFLGLEALAKGVKVDLSLDNISCCTIENGFILIKCIALKPDDNVVEFGDWKKEVIKLYEEIQKKLGDKMFHEYNEAKKLLENSNTKEDFRSILQSWVFWDIDKRMSLIYKLTSMLGKHGLYFFDYCDGAVNILKWRQMMSRNKLFKSSVDGFLANKLQNRRECTAYERQEVLLFVTFLRTCLGHFSTFQNQFTSEEMLLRYLDHEFSDIMAEVYRGCTRMEQKKRFGFGIDE